MSAAIKSLLTSTFGLSSYLYLHLLTVPPSTSLLKIIAHSYHDRYGEQTRACCNVKQLRELAHCPSKVPIIGNPAG